MKMWRRILMTGIILGFVVQVIDFFVITIPYIIIIPLEIVAIVLIFTGFIMRKREKEREMKS